MSISTVQYVGWILGPILQVCIAGIMIRRTLHRELPWFFWFTVFQIVQFVVLFTAFHIAYAPYFYLYWLSEGIHCLLGLAVIQEIYRHAFLPFDRLRGFSSLIFKLAAVALVVVAIGVAMVTQGNERNRMVAGLLTLDQSAGFVQCGLLFVVLLMKQALGLRWRQPSTGIALGMGIASSSLAISLTVRAYSTRPENGVIALMVTLFYDVALVVWLAALLKRNPELDSTQVPENDLLRKWNSALVEIMGR